MKIQSLILAIAITVACQEEPYSVQHAVGEDHAVSPAQLYGACDAYVVTDRSKDIDLSSAEEFFRPAVFRLAVVAGVPTEVEILMLASHADDEPLYSQQGELWQVGLTQQPDLLLKDGERHVNRYRGDSEDEQDSINIDWYADIDSSGVARVMRVDFASDAYNSGAGVRRWGRHYVCHRNVGINAIDSDSYRAQIEAPPAADTDSSD